MRLAALGAAILTLALAARAAAEPRPIRVDYQAHAGCPAAEALAEEITWRTPRARLAAAGEEATPIKARVTKRGAASRGRITVGAGKDAVTRTIDGESCAEIVGALGLVAALALDPHAATGHKPPHPPPPPPPPPKRAALPARPIAPALPPPAPDLLAPPLPALPAPARAVSASYAIGARATAAFAVAPGPLFGGAIFAERIAAAALRPSIGIEIEVAATGARDAGPGRAAFLRAAGRITGCVLAPRPEDTFALVPCLAVEGGVLRGQGIASGSITSASAATVPWFALDLLPRVVVRAGPAFLVASGGPVFPLVRRKFVFESPDFLVFELPAVTAAASIGAGVHFP